MVKAETGLSTLFCLDKPFKRLCEEIRKIDASCFEIVDDGLHSLDKRKVSALRSLSASYGVKYTVHAPFSGINISLSCKPLLTATIKRLKQSITHASSLDCRLWVFHPGVKSPLGMFYPGSDWRTNLESVRLLFEFASDCGVEAAVENIMEPLILKSVDDFERFYNEVNVPVGLVLDTGHANLIGQVESFLTRLPDRIVHVHAHDNNGKNDQHLGVGYGNIDWKSFSGLVKKAGFGRLVIIESFEHVQESLEKMKLLLS